MKKEKLLEMKSITKTFAGVIALDKVDFKVRNVEVHGLVGENGAGKSTLIKILTGILPKNEGEIYFDGKKINPTSALDAQNLGISTIYQEINLIPNLSVAENIFLNREPKNKGLIDWKKMKNNAEAVLHDIGISNIDVSETLNKYSIAVQQMVSIARAISIEAKLVVMDEPTSSLDKNEVKILFDVINGLKEEGVSVIFISHRLNEVFEICDSVTILRDGRLIGEYNIDEISELDLVTKMVGKKVNKATRKNEKFTKQKCKIICRATDITTKKLRDVNIEIHEGEIVGLAGLLGSGRTELAKVIFGDDTSYEGKIEINGEGVSFNSPRDAIKNNIAYCPEDRKEEGIFPSMSVKDNMTIASLFQLSKLCFVSQKKQKEIVDKYIDRLHIKTPSLQQAVKYLSGGNQQKVILSRWLITNPSLFIFDEPTRGIDVAVKSEIEYIIQEIASSGIGVLMISSEFDELIRNCDRIIVLNDGKIIKELVGNELTVDNIIETITIDHQLSKEGLTINE